MAKKTKLVKISAPTNPNFGWTHPFSKWPSLAWNRARFKCIL